MEDDHDILVSGVGFVIHKMQKDKIAKTDACSRSGFASAWAEGLTSNENG